MLEQIGKEVYSKKLFGAMTSGSLIREKYGVYSGIESVPVTLYIRKAARDYRCEDCGNQITKGTLHAGTYYEHYCLNCVTDERKVEFKPRTA